MGVLEVEGPQIGGVRDKREENATRVGVGGGEERTAGRRTGPALHHLRSRPGPLTGPLIFFFDPEIAK